MIAVLLALAAPSNAQTAAQLVDGSPDFTDCLDDPQCEGNFLAFLSGSIAEQGFTMQHNPLATSAVVRSGSGVIVGARLDTFPFGPPPTNLSGKEENTQFSPVLPRLVVGWIGEGDRSRQGAGAFFLPPVTVGGASALVVGGDLSLARQLSDRMRLGVEADFTYVRATAPVAATEDQLDGRDDFSNPDNLDPDLFADVCGDTDCLDTFHVANTAVKAVAAWDLGERWGAYGKVGLTYVSERLHVAYDDTTWAVRGLQPSVHGGATVAASDAVLLAAGASVAPKHPGINDGGLPLFYKLEGSASFAF